MNKMPTWLKESLPDKTTSKDMVALLKEFNLNTVCQSARCPNIGKCFSKKTATFMILGNTCTRCCTFCAVKKGKPDFLDEKEPENIAKACKILELKHVVITSVTRDDLPDGGANQFVKVINEIKKLTLKIVIEVLTPDFLGDFNNLEIVINAKPHIFNHNIETVPSLYSQIRPEANFNRSIMLLKKAKELSKEIYTKSGIMVGMGETKDEIYEVMENLREINCDILTIGQYLQPTGAHYSIKEYITPDIFNDYKNKAYELGFKHVESAPLVRSSLDALKFSEKFGLVET